MESLKSGYFLYTLTHGWLKTGYLIPAISLVEVGFILSQRIMKRMLF
jgi:hypothetical protein